MRVGELVVDQHGRRWIAYGFTAGEVRTADSRPERPKLVLEFSLAHQLMVAVDERLRGRG